MDSGKIIIGIARVELSADLLTSPAGTTGCDRSCTVGCGSATSPPYATVTPYSLWDGKILLEALHRSIGQPIMGAHHDPASHFRPCILFRKSHASV